MPAWFTQVYGKLPELSNLCWNDPLGPRLPLNRPVVETTVWVAVSGFSHVTVAPRSTVRFPGEKDGKRFLPILTTMFFMILFMNLTGVIPFLNIAGTSVIGVPLVLAIVSYVTFIYAGIKKSPKNFVKNSLFPSGVPLFVLPIVALIELISTFILRPVTLTLRLLMNMIVGHLLLVLFFSATQFFLFTMGGAWSALAAGSLVFGFAFTLFEILVAILQAYVFTLLTAVYIQLAVAEEH